jgi:hypothetical protein
MAATAAPYGLRYTNLQGGQVSTHGMRLLPITLNYATNIFNGDLVTLTSGLITKDTGTTTAAPIGVFVGCEYEDAALGLFHRNYWPASTVIKTGTTAWAYVIDDPDALFEIQSDAAVTYAMIGLNADLTQGVPAAAAIPLGRSAVSMAATAPSGTATRPLRIVDFVRRPGSVVGDAKTDVIVRINTHKNRTP